MKPIVCTKEHPASPEMEGQLVYHKDAKRIPGQPVPCKDGDKSILHCPNCGLDIITTARKMTLKQILEERDSRG